MTMQGLLVLDFDGILGIITQGTILGEIILANVLWQLDNNQTTEGGKLITTEQIWHAEISF